MNHATRNRTSRSVGVVARGRSLMTGYRRYGAGFAIPVVVLALVASGCGGSNTVKDPKAEYFKQVDPEIQRIAKSAEITQRTLARVSAPNQLSASRTTLVRQLDLVDEARANLTARRPENEAVRPAYARVNNAATAHRRYLVQLTRSMGQTDGKGLATLDSAGKLATTTTQAWSKVSADGSTAADAIASAEIADVSGVRTALRAQATESAAKREEAKRAAAAEAARRTPVPVPVTGDRGVSPTVSLSEARAMTEQAWILIQNGRYSEAEYLSEQALTALAGSGDAREGNAYYNLGVSRLRQGRCSDALGPLAEATTKTGTSQQQRIRSETYAEAQRCS